MNPDRLDELIDKYAFGTISPEELEELLDWYQSAKVGTVEWPAEELEEKDHLKQRSKVIPLSNGEGRVGEGVGGN